jgi:hypothetical protein
LKLSSYAANGDVYAGLRLQGMLNQDPNRKNRNRRS